MTAPLTDERLAEIEDRARLAYAASGHPAQFAGHDVPELVAEIRRLRQALDLAGRELQMGALDTTGPMREIAGLRAELDAVAETRDRALALLERGVDDEPCDVDQHGLCQAHWLSPAPCRNAEARRLLGLDAP